jgi:hypothetical protein
LIVSLLAGRMAYIKIGNMLISRRLQQARKGALYRWSKSSAYDKTILSLALLYVAATGGYLVWHHNLISPDQFFILVLLISLLLGRAKTFLWDWLPLVVLLFGYEYVRGLVPLINEHIHLQPMIDADRFVFGGVPTIVLQARYYTPDSPHWYDYAAVSLYLAHFILPLGVAFLFWLQDRKIFKEYASGVLILSYLAYLTYLVFPAAPPWLAAQSGLLPPVHRILSATLMAFRDPIYLPTLYTKLGVNQVAAVPSLHAAYPLLTALFVGEKMPKLLPLLALYVFSVWMAIVYLGEHYAFDVFMGAIYAVAAYGLVVYWPAIRAAMGRQRAPLPQVYQGS